MEYDKNRIPEAKNAPLGSLVFRVAAVMNPDSEVVVYSDGGDCKLAAEAVEQLEKLRLRNVFYYEEGLAGWKMAGHESVP